MIPDAALPAKDGTRTGTSRATGDRAAARPDRLAPGQVAPGRVAPGQIGPDPMHHVHRARAAENGAPALHGPGIESRQLRARMIAAPVLRGRTTAGLLRARMIAARVRRGRMIVGLRRGPMTAARVLRGRMIAGLLLVPMIVKPARRARMHPMRALPAPVHRGSAMAPADLPNSVLRATQPAPVRENQVRRNLPA
nr:hypothetical protein [Arthrobacter terrae]